MKEFSEHKDACNYAKNNLGFIVVRNGKKWIVGEQEDIFDLSKQQSLKNNKNTSQVEKYVIKKTGFSTWEVGYCSPEGEWLPKGRYANEIAAQMSAGDLNGTLTVEEHAELRRRLDYMFMRNEINSHLEFERGDWIIDPKAVWHEKMDENR
ncbi:MAG: hypothetical protein DRP56_04600 [Planctomycetota bacterium]|nr:MAG: hypothetical protein DRP56_04600 [Planctomycetota bacterium]